MTATVYCNYLGYYWQADCTFPGGDVCKSQQRTHGSARQAAGEVLQQLRAQHGETVTMLRRSPKVYQVFILEDSK